MAQRSDIPREFFTAQEQLLLAEAIGAAERRTSGEIRLHVERDAPGGEPYLRAREVFADLGMHQTADRNGVLFYLATRSRQFAVLGDEELHRRVGEDFWTEIRDLLAARFRDDLFVEGLAAAIALVGERLREHFPHREDDVNELPDDVSY